MSDAIQPALTADEWALVIREGDLVFTLSAMGDGITVGGESDHLVAARQIVAVANHFLPDGHPNKLTREDLQSLRAMLALDPHDSADNDGEGYYDPRQSAAMQRALSGIERVAAKLAALLSPE